ncbi:hypothetical protein GS909_16020 [Rhodococcus hoagii]|nr:hypothetical protein [Prescottella equi]
MPAFLGTLGQLESRPHDGARRDAAEDAFLRAEVARPADRVVELDVDDLV